MVESDPPLFGPRFNSELQQLFRWRRDVRRFRCDPVPEDALMELLEAAHTAPSVGNSQPWRIIRVADHATREAVASHVDRCNADAADKYEGVEQEEYRKLKLHGLREAPVQLAFYCDRAPDAGRGLGRQTMAQTLEWSVVMAIHSLWLAARARGLGLGWVSILDPAILDELFEVPSHWGLVGYICLGYPMEAEDQPELEKLKWQQRLSLSDILFQK